MSESNAERSTSNEQPRATSDASSRSERPDLANSTSGIESDSTGGTPTEGGQESGVHQGERPELGTGTSDGREPANVHGSGVEGKDFERAGPDPRDIGPGTGDPTDKAAVRAPEARSDGDAHQRERPEVGTNQRDSAGAGANDRGDISKTRDSYPLTGKEKAEYKRGEREIHSHTDIESKGESKGSADSSSRIVDGNKQTHTVNKDASGNRTGTSDSTSTTDKKGVTHTHTVNKDANGNPTGTSDSTSTTDKKGVTHTHTVNKDANGKPTGTSDSTSTTDSTGMTHTHTTNKDTNGHPTSSSHSTSAVVGSARIYSA
ncbi:hypothetical protein ABT272_39505 [Streptomyces sp900105245]|uniref:Uncharacterized protein n=1 Tax=Streptomyces sp. 900105245 TaxID=3154379 RepID=A0ABV1UJ47_9ACTN